MLLIFPRQLADKISFQTTGKNRVEKEWVK